MKGLLLSASDNSCKLKSNHTFASSNDTPKSPGALKLPLIQEEVNNESILPKRR
jgi:hypothetical protein